MIIGISAGIVVLVLFATVILSMCVVAGRADDNSERILLALQAQGSDLNGAIARSSSKAFGEHCSIEAGLAQVRDANPAVEAIARLLDGEEVLQPAASIPIVAQVKTRLDALAWYDRIANSSSRKGA
jgi:predicted DNA-binding protein